MMISRNNIGIKSEQLSEKVQNLTGNYPPRVFGKMIGKCVSTLQKWDRLGVLKAHRTPITNRRYYTHDQYLTFLGMKANSTKKTIVYYRVSSANQKGDMANQRIALEQFCTANGYCVDEWLNDVGSGLNFKRKNFDSLMQMIEMGQVSRVIIAHKDRLVRFGYEWFETFAQRHGTAIMVMNNETLSPEAEMVQDLLSIIHCFSSRLYGLRKYAKKVKEALHEAHCDAP
jgi:putative resolvase